MVDQALVIVQGDSLFFRVQLKGFALHRGIIADSGSYVVAAHHSGGGEAHADIGAFGQADAARSDGQLALVCGLNSDVAAVQFSAGVFAARYIYDRFPIGHQHADRSGDGHVGILSRHGTTQGLGSQPSGEIAVQVLGQAAGNGDVILIIAYLILFDLRLSLVAVDADSHTRGDGVGVLRLGYCRGSAQSAKVAAIHRADLNLFVCSDFGHGNGSFMTGNREAHSGGNLPLLVVVSVFFAVRAHVLASRFLDLVFDCLRAFDARVFALGFHILGAQYVGGERVFLIRVGFRVLFFILLLLLFLVQPGIDLVSGLVFLRLGIVKFVNDGAVQELICLLFDFICFFVQFF